MRGRKEDWQEIQECPLFNGIEGREDNLFERLLFALIEENAHFPKSHSGSYFWREPTATGAEKRESDGFQLIDPGGLQSALVAFG